MITHLEGRSKLRPTMKALLAALIGGWGATDVDSLAQVSTLEDGSALAAPNPHLFADADPA